MHFDMLELKPQQLYQYILSSFPSMAAGRAGQRRAGGPMSPWTQILQKRYKLSLSCAQKLSLTTITHTQGGFCSLTYCTSGCSDFAHFIFAILFCQNLSILPDICPRCLKADTPLPTTAAPLPCTRHSPLRRAASSNNFADNNCDVASIINILNMYVQIFLYGYLKEDI